MTKYFLRSIILTTLLLLTFSAVSQQLVLKNYKTKDGLPSSEVYCCFQDSKGFIWFGSDGGVSKFDGYTFKNYTIEDGLVDNVVFEIMEDKHSRIWFRSLSGKLCYIKNDSIYKIDANKKIEECLGNALMTSFYIDSKDTIWCGIRAGSGYFKIAPNYTTKDFKLVPIKLGGYIINIESGNFISGSTFLAEKWSMHLDSILFYDKNTLQKKINILSLNTGRLNYSKFINGSILLADAKNIFLIQDNRVKAFFAENQLSNAQPVFVKHIANFVWIGLLEKGILKFPEKNIFWQNKEQILDGKTVTDVLFDNEGGLWFTTLENGVYYSSPEHFTSYQNPKVFYGYKSYSIEKAGNNYFLISYKINKVDIISPNKIIKDVDINDSNLLKILSKQDVPSLAILTGNSLRQDSFAAYLWLRNNQTLKKIVAKGGSVPSKIEFFADCKTDNKLYLIDRTGIQEFDASIGYNKKVAVLPSRAFSYYKDKNDVIWLGCTNGLWSFGKGKFNYHGNEHILLKSIIEDIKETNDGTRYYATRGNGILIGRNNEYTKITTAQGLSSNNCKCLFIEDESTVWVGSKNGICKLKKEKTGWQCFKIDLPDDGFSYEVTKIEKTGDILWLYTNKGLLNYQLANGKTSYPPKIYLTNFFLNDISHFKDSLQVYKYNQNSFKASFIGLSFQSFGKLYYNYKLQGIDTAWHTTQSTSIQYPFLPPGKYTFYVRAISFGGVKSKSIASISFTIKKPFWETAWFISLVITLIIFVIALIFYYQLQKVKKKEEEKNIFNMQLAELEMKALRSQMNPHFIFNAINSIQNYIVKNDAKTAQNYLAKFARLIRNVLENSLHCANPRRTRRRINSYLSTWLDWESAKLNESQEMFKNRIIREMDVVESADSENTDQDNGINWKIKNRINAGVQGIRRQSNTVQKDWAIIKSNELPDEFCIAVIGRKGWETKTSSEVPYAITISFEVLTPQNQIQLYNLVQEVNQEVQVQAAPQLELFESTF